MQLDNHTIEPGDIIYDLVDGPLSVLDVTPTRFTVRLTGGQYRDYDSSGKCQSRRVATAFWHDPIIAIPHKDAESWAAQRTHIKQVAEILKAQARLVD